MGRSPSRSGPASDDELARVANVVAELRPPVLVVGRGSNLLVADGGFAGVGLLLEGDFERIDLPGDGAADGAGTAAVVLAGAAVALPVLARRLAAAGWTGLEFFVGIPGSVGRRGPDERGRSRPRDAATCSRAAGCATCS